MCQEIKDWSRKELYLAVKAHGGSYNFCNTLEEANLPIVAVAFDTFFNFRVQSVRIDKDGDLVLRGYDIEGEYCELDVMVEDVMTGELAYLIDEIDNTMDVNDVSLTKEELEDKDFA